MNNMHNYLVEIKLRSRLNNQAKKQADQTTTEKPNTFINYFNGTPFGKALAKGLDENAYTYMITCVNPLKSDENLTRKVLSYSAEFHKVNKKQPLPSPIQLATLEYNRIKKNIKLLKELEREFGIQSSLSEIRLSIDSYQNHFDIQPDENRLDIQPAKNRLDIQSVENRDDIHQDEYHDDLYRFELSNNEMFFKMSL